MSVWFITGCSSGFGAGLARLALDAGHKVIATSRNPSKTPELVKEVESRGGSWLQLDVCSPDLPKVLDEALSIHGRIDVLINNAAFSLLGAVEDISDAEARKQMETNFFAPLNIIRHVLPSMRRERSGTIVNISSTAGQVALPACGMYAASKHALEALSESLSYELSPLGIRVLIIEPGGFNTNFASSVQTPAQPMTPDYAETPVAAVLRSIPTLAGQQFGDVHKGCRAIFDIVTRTGLAEEGLQEEFLRIPLGTDCAKRLRGKFEVLQSGLEGTRAVWESTDREGMGEGQQTMLDFNR